MLNGVREIFDGKRGKDIPLTTRISAADALALARDTRLFLPGDDGYWVKIEGGPCAVGEQKTDPSDEATFDPLAYHNEPVRRGHLDTFHIGRFPVTVWEYGKYLYDTGAKAPGDWEMQQAHPSRPAVGVSWHDASAYCKWAGVLLPIEEQWEYAARGTEGRRYPWGPQWPDAERANFAETKIGVPTPVGLFPAGNTPEGVADMAGNVWEWTKSKYDKEFMEVRGASFGYAAGRLRAAVRDGLPPDDSNDDIGFRCVRE